MQVQHFGDSYDVVKQSLLRWLAVHGEWIVHPMFTDRNGDGQFVTDFEKLLGSKVICREKLTADTDRDAYLRVCSVPANVFLDPDTGLSLRGQPREKAPQYLFGDELMRIVTVGCRTEYLTMVFDQSLQGGKEFKQLDEKLSWLRERGLACFAYCSHASFIVVGRHEARMVEVRKRVILDSCLPSSRFLAAESAMAARAAMV